MIIDGSQAQLPPIGWPLWVMLDFRTASSPSTGGTAALACSFFMLRDVSVKVCFVVVGSRQRSASRSLRRFPDPRISPKHLYQGGRSCSPRAISTYCAARRALADRVWSSGGLPDFSARPRSLVTRKQHHRPESTKWRVAFPIAFCPCDARLDGSIPRQNDGQRPAQD